MFGRKSERSEKKYKECIEKAGNSFIKTNYCRKYKPIDYNTNSTSYSDCIEKANNDSGKTMKCRLQYNRI